MQESAERALVRRVEPHGSQCRVITLAHSFEGVSERSDSLKAAGAGISWNIGGFHEVVLTHLGKKLGTTKAKYRSPANCSALSKRALYTLFCEVARIDGAGIGYKDAKQQNMEYCKLKEQIKAEHLHNWLSKEPSLDDFNVSAMAKDTPA